MMLVAAIWGCKKSESSKIADQPATATNAQVMAGKMTKVAADRAGELHNGGLGSIKTYLEDVVNKGLNDVTPEELNDRLSGYMQAQGMNYPASAFNYQGAYNNFDANEAPENITANLLADGKITAKEKFYLDKAVEETFLIAATINPDEEEEDPNFRPDLQLEAKISQIQDLVINDEDLSEESHNKLLMSLSIMKSSAIYWYTTDQLMLEKSANGKIAISSACKKCLKANWGRLLLNDVKGFLYGWILSLGFWGSLPGAIYASLVACGRICSMCM